MFHSLQKTFEEHKLDIDLTLQSYDSILANVVDTAKPVLEDVLRESPVDAQVINFSLVNSGVMQKHSA